MDKSKETLRIQSWILFVAVLLFSIKIIAWWLTRSVAILTDALESIVNVIAGIVGLYSLTIAYKPRDINHPYGHGKAEFLSAAIEGTLIMLAGVFIIYEAVSQLIHPKELQKLNYGILLVGISAIINFVVGLYAVKKGEENNSEALQASGQHLKSDTYSTLAIIIGLFLIYFTHIPQLDSVVAIIMSVVIMVIGYRIARKSVAGIMDEADEKILGKVIALLNNSRIPNWIDIHNLRVIKFGNVLHVDCHMTVPWYLNVREAHEEIDRLRKLIQSEFGSVMEFFVHSDGCIPNCCPVCIKSDCKVREHPFIKKIEWEMQNAIPNKKHDVNTPF
ncbi:MAG TPA: cation diffusion facilitator family transporter [Puia sp.]|nr:cation diffusion facilitator family transporter [Puia sp.]